MSVKLQNPYRQASGQWVRGSFHGHCSEHSMCSSVALAKGVAMYREIGARFMALTDHDHITGLAKMRAAYPDMVLLEGFEYSSCENLMFVGETAPELFRHTLDEALARANGLLTIVAHPEPRPGETYWTPEHVLSLEPLPDGIEVYNGHYGVPKMAANGRNPLYTSFWDRVLTHGHCLWGYVNDDFHDPPDFDNAFNMVMVDRPTPAKIVAAAKAGRCYGSTGLLLDAIEEEDGRLAVTTSAACTGRFVGPGGAVLAESEGRSFEFTVTSEAYVRFEAEGEAGRLFLQPLFQDK